jgi:hypothetical protein
LKTVANGGNISSGNGYDIIFKAEDGETKLDHEIEKYDGSATGGTLVAWVRIPTLRYNANTIIYMYYGNPEVTAPTANKAGVWINNFREVWHLNETAGGTVADSTSSGYSGTNGLSRKVVKRAEVEVGAMRRARQHSLAAIADAIEETCGITISELRGKGKDPDSRR